VTSAVTRDLTWPQRVETTDLHDTHQPTDSHGRCGPGSPDAPQRGRPARTDEGDTPLALCGPAPPRTVPAGPDVSLGPLGWLAVLLVAALLTVLVHAASMRPGHAEHLEPPLLTNPAQALAQ